MARLSLHRFDAHEEWLNISLEPIELGPDEPDYQWTDGVRARVSFFPDGDRGAFASEFDTRKWQLGKDYFLRLALLFARADSFAHTLFPVGGSDDDAWRPLECTAHVTVDHTRLHVLLRGVSLRKPSGEVRDPDRLSVECFVRESEGRFAYLQGFCTTTQAEQFGRDLLKELEAVKECSDSDEAS